MGLLGHSLSWLNTRTFPSSVMACTDMCAVKDSSFFPSAIHFKNPGTECSNNVHIKKTCFL